MFRPSPFAVPVGSFTIPVEPPAVDPDAAPLVYVGLNCDWMPYITGALTQLLLQSTWEVNTPDELQLVQDRAWNLINLFNCQFLPTLAELCGVQGGDGECMGCCIRFQNGKFQTLDCGVWTDIPGQPDAGFGPVNGQSGQGAPQPLPGECRQFAGTLPANGSYLLPVPLSTGDTVEISNVDGATNDNTITWWLQDGQIYFAGEAQGPVVFVPGDPVGSFPHAGIIGSFDGGSTFFGIGTALFTVPGGIVNQQLQLFVNFPMDLPRYGQYTFEIAACNNQAGEFTHTFDLSLGTEGWLPYTPGGGTSIGDWTAGVGYTASDGTLSGKNSRGITIAYNTFSARDLIDVTVLFSYTKGTADTPSDIAWAMADNATQFINVAFSGTTDGDHTLFQPVSDSAQTTLAIQFLSDLTAGARSGAVTIRKIIVHGIGTDPFV